MTWRHTFRNNNGEIVFECDCEHATEADDSYYKRFGQRPLDVWGLTCSAEVLDKKEEKY